MHPPVMQTLSNALLPCENIISKAEAVLETREWIKLQEDFNKSAKIYVIGNGGNLAVADHAAVDITRLSKKLAIAPGSGILATSIIGDNCIDTWFCNWLQACIDADQGQDFSKHLVIGISSSGTASNIVSALELASKYGMNSSMLSSRFLKETNPLINTVQLGVDFYHSGEVLSLLLAYQLIYGSGSNCPSISGKLNEPSFDRLVNNSQNSI
jgi:D-sedoheptulose 7-phosphate isomerase